MLPKNYFRKLSLENCQWEAKRMKQKQKHWYGANKQTKTKALEKAVEYAEA